LSELATNGDGEDAVGGDSHVYLRWNGIRWEAEGMVVVAVVLFVGLCCLVSIIIFCGGESCKRGNTTSRRLTFAVVANSPRVCLIGLPNSSSSFHISCFHCLPTCILCMHLWVVLCV
jgi:hypothetical protein